VIRVQDEEDDVSDREVKDSERYYRTYQRGMVLGLVFVVCLAAYEVVGLFRPASAGWGVGGLLIGAAYLVLLLIVSLVTLGGRVWKARGPSERRVLDDEWIRLSRGRGFEIAFWVMILMQWPMMFFMAYVPSRPERGVVGMGSMTILLGLMAFFASALYYSRQPSDG